MPPRRFTRLLSLTVSLALWCPDNDDRSSLALRFRETKYQALDLNSVHMHSLMDAASHIDNYFEELRRLEYPNELISLGFHVSTTAKNSSQISTLVKQASYRIVLVETTRSIVNQRVLDEDEILFEVGKTCFVYNSRLESLDTRPDSHPKPKADYTL
ncbi:hypothetical protein EDD21DRAFT_400874 [Dissophora ornata]|nr:hypothetical protein EDD21DRAFT_400874 [Dissophora ornata]